MVFVFGICNHFFIVVDMVVKTVNIFIFFSSLCSKSIISNIVEGYILSHFGPFK